VSVCKRFLDHEPMDEEASEEDYFSYENFLYLYSYIFNEDAPYDVWPRSLQNRFKVLSPGFRIL
jgi:hypothetical protein